MLAGIDLAIAVSFVLVATDRVPSFNVEPGCRDVAVRAAPVGSMEACMRKEEEARNQLISEWTQFAPADKSYCVDLTTMAGEPSYVALLTCLELRRDARRAENGKTTQRRGDSGSPREMLPIGGPGLEIGRRQRRGLLPSGAEWIRFGAAFGSGTV
jgi:hypothetical protein